MSEPIETYAIIAPSGDLVGSTLNEYISTAWDEVEDNAWKNRRWEALEKEGYKLIELTWQNTSERIVQTSNYTRGL